MNPREKALDLIEQDVVDATTLLLSCLEYMSCADIQDMLELECYLEQDGEEEQEEVDTNVVAIIKYDVYFKDDTYLHTVYFPETLSEDAIVEGLVTYEGFPQGISIKRA